MAKDTTVKSDTPSNLPATCPGCGRTDSFQRAPQLTAAQRAADRKDPNYVAPNPRYDTATLAQIEEHGELWRCGGCEYPFRPKQQEKADKAAGV